MGNENTTQPLAGFRDFTPEDWSVQKYIFDIWTRVCKKYNYQEYNSPVLERVEIYNKSGDDVGSSGKELYAFEDRGGREVALRPEMTPSVGRMIAAYGKSYPKPIRWFSIAQFFRAEKPQRGRGREFFQLNADIFGSASLGSDAEVINREVDTMLEFGASPEMFTLKINNRKFTDYYFENFLEITSESVKSILLRILDASPKKGKEWMRKEIEEMGLGEKQNEIESYLNLNLNNLQDYYEKSDGAKEIIDLFRLLKQVGIDGYCKFNTSMARGFDYYTVMVFEVFDNNPKNNRSMFGGGRYDDLLDVFNEPKMPAVGFAIGDITTRLFLESWGLLDAQSLSASERYYLPVLDESLKEETMQLAGSLRGEGKLVEMGLGEESISKALSYANKLIFEYVVIMGLDELSKKIYKIKNMESGKEMEHAL